MINTPWRIEDDWELEDPALAISEPKLLKASQKWRPPCRFNLILLTVSVMLDRPLAKIIFKIKYTRTIPPRTFQCRRKILKTSAVILKLLRILARDIASFFAARFFCRRVNGRCLGALEATVLELGFLLPFFTPLAIP